MLSNSSNKKYLDKTGLGSVISKVKAMVGTKSEETLNAAKEYVDSLPFSSQLPIIETVGYGDTYAGVTSGDNDISELKAGVSLIMIPNTTNTNRAPLFSVNGLGYKQIRRRISSVTSATSDIEIGQIIANKPVELMYDGTFWIMNLPKTDSNDIYGNVPVASGGTGANNAENARTNLDVYSKDEVAPKMHAAQSTDENPYPYGVATNTTYGHTILMLSPTPEGEARDFKKAITEYTAWSLDSMRLRSANLPTGSTNLTNNVYYNRFFPGDLEYCYGIYDEAYIDIQLVRIGAVVVGSFCTSPNFINYTATPRFQLPIPSTQNGIFLPNFDRIDSQQIYGGRYGVNPSVMTYKVNNNSVDVAEPTWKIKSVNDNDYVFDFQSIPSGATRIYGSIIYFAG